MPTEQNISSPPATNLSAFESYPSQTIGVHIRKKPNAVGIVLVVGGIAVVAAFATLALFINRKRTHPKALRSLGSRQDSLRSLPIDSVQGGLFK